MAKDLAADVKAGTLDGMSFGFRVRDGGAEMDKNYRTLTNIDLREISVVTFPAYDDSRIAMRGLMDPEELRKYAEFEYRQRCARVKTLAAECEA